MEFEQGFLQALQCLPQHFYEKLYGYRMQADIEEIRLRAGQPVSLKLCTREQRLDGHAICAQELRDVLGKATGYSLHSHTQYLKHGFITLQGGHRLGICGTAVLEHTGEVSGLRNISSLNLRIACERQIDCSDMSVVQDGKILPTLLIAPPGIGKTTLLRTLITTISRQGFTVGVADERGEIAAMVDGVPQFCLGPYTDVVDGCSKKQAVQMLLKTMSPHVIALDEITSEPDLEAVMESAYCGVPIVASLHAKSIEEAQKNPLYRKLFALSFFKQAICIDMRMAARCYHSIRIREESSC